MHDHERCPNDPCLIISLGSTNADFEFRVDRRPEISETVIAQDLVRLGGGKAANVALLAVKMGHPALLLSCVGDDDLSEQALKSLRAAGVDLRHVARAPGHATGTAFIAVPPDGKKGIFLAPNANDNWPQGRIDAAVAVVREAPRMPFWWSILKFLQAQPAR